MLRQSLARSARSLRFTSTVAKAAPRPLSNAYVNQLESRWETLPQADQTALINDLKERMKVSWGELSVAEKKAAYYISYGEWGPRAPLYGPGEKSKIFWGTMAGMGAGLVVFLLLKVGFVKKTVSNNREWQEKSDEYLKSQNANPFTGYSQVQ